MTISLISPNTTDLVFADEFCILAYVLSARDLNDLVDLSPYSTGQSAELVLNGSAHPIQW